MISKAKGNEMEKVKAIICDLDGTLANVDHRVHFVRQRPKDWDNFHSNMVHDQLNLWCKEIVQAFHERGYAVIMVTGRDEPYREKTLEWLKKNLIPFDELHMRPKNDRRLDQELKQEIYETKLKDKYDILFIIEDRKSVVTMWRSIGLTCLQCDWGDF